MSKEIIGKKDNKEDLGTIHSKESKENVCQFGIKVSNLDKEITKEDLYKYFRSNGSISEL